ncbi:phosphotransferase [Kitasatospora indigofera]|uniref:phosphotransferase n=1 Tax=Kitasatospora indigofera TaxID=67307 RepID=UPI0033BEAA44
MSALEAVWSSLPVGMPPSVIHGDAWRGNVAVAPSTTYLLDFERTSWGPPA